MLQADGGTRTASITGGYVALGAALITYGMERLLVGKVAVSCADRSGFIVNCLLFPYLNDACTLAESGVELTVIDEAIKAEAGFPMGPFQLLDVVGNDVSLAIQKELFAEFKEPGFAPAALLEQVVADGKLGRKTGAGFHDYS